MAAILPARAAFLRRCPFNRLGITLVELLIVIGIIGLLLALLLPALASARESARQVACASQLRSLGHAMASYANEFNGVIPRDTTAWRPDRSGFWLSMYLKHGDHAGEVDTEGDALLLCPSHHENAGQPGSYVINAFKFEVAPSWDPDGPVKLVKVQQASNIVLVAESADRYGEDGDVPDLIFSKSCRDMYRPDHLPGLRRQRITDERHRGAANFLMFDSSVPRMERGALRLEMFDDGVTQRMTPPVLMGPS